MILFFSSITGTYSYQRVAEGFDLASMAGDPIIVDNFSNHRPNRSRTPIPICRRAERLGQRLNNLPPDELARLAHEWAVTF